MKRFVVAWHPRLFSAGYSGPSRNFVGLFDTDDIGLSIIVLTAACEISAPKTDLRIVRIAQVKGEIGILQQACLVARVCYWILRNRRSIGVFYAISGFYYALLPAMFAKLLGIRSVVRPAGTHDFRSWRGGFLGWSAAKLRAVAVRYVGNVVAINSEIAAWAGKIGVTEGGRCLLYNTVDTERFSPGARIESVGGSGRALTVCYVGGWVRRKRLHTVVAAIAQLREEGFNVRCTVAGPKDDPVYAREIEAMIETAAMAEAFTWMGTISEMVNVYQASDVFCLPSSSEGMSNALLEAQACGLPAIVTNIPGMSDVVVSGVSGFIISDASDASVISEVKQALRAYLLEPSMLTEHGVAARRTIEASFDVREARRAIAEFLTRDNGADNRSKNYEY